MDHLTKEQILDLSSENYRVDIDCDSTTWLSSTLNSPKVKITSDQKQKRDIIVMCGHHEVSAEELRIRRELEMEIEKDLEQEIKESIYHLALRLHRIYKQRKDRGNSNNNNSNARSASRAVSEVNISIRMEGVEIKEVNKQEVAAERGYHKCTSKHVSNSKFDCGGAKNSASSSNWKANNNKKKKKRVQLVWKV